MSTPSEAEVKEAPGRYEIHLGGERVGYADVVLDGDLAILPHVEIDPAHEGQGLGSKLVKATLADLKAKGRTIQARCPFVVAYLGRHPDEA